MHWGPEWLLFKHLQSAHRESFQEELTACGIDAKDRASTLKNEEPLRKKRPEEKWHDDLFLQVISVYMKAVCVRQQRGMPDVGPCIDRRVLRIINAMLPNVKAMMCFGCAQIQTHVPLWKTMYNPATAAAHYFPDGNGASWTEHRKANYSHNAIEMYKVQESLE